MKIFLILICFFIGLLLYACIHASARADEQAQRLYQRYKEENLKKL